MWRLREEETKIRVDENCRDSDSRGWEENNGDGIQQRERKMAASRGWEGNNGRDE